MKSPVLVWKLLAFFLCALLLAGCGGGGAPPAGGLPNGAATNTVTFSITDSCNDGYTLWVAFYDNADGERWPSPGTGYTVTDGNTLSQTLNCVSGSDICFGASDNGNDAIGFWGVGYSGTNACADGMGCCDYCNGGHTSFDLTCSGDPNALPPGISVRHPQLPRGDSSSLVLPFGTGGSATLRPLRIVRDSLVGRCPGNNFKSSRSPLYR